MDEKTLDILSGAPEENGLWLEAVGCLASSQQRTGQMAAAKPGEYFLLSSADQSILTRVDTRSRTMFARYGDSMRTLILNLRRLRKRYVALKLQWVHDKAIARTRNRWNDAVRHPAASAEKPQE